MSLNCTCKKFWLATMSASCALRSSGLAWLLRTPCTSCGMWSATAYTHETHGLQYSLLDHLGIKQTQSADTTKLKTHIKNVMTVAVVAYKSWSIRFRIMFIWNSNITTCVVNLQVIVGICSIGLVASHLAALHQLLMCSRVLVGGGSVLSSSNGLSGCSCSLLGSILRTENECLKTVSSVVP